MLAIIRTARRVKRVATLQELDALLNKFAAQASAEQPEAIFVERPNGDTLTLAVVGR